MCLRGSDRVDNPLSDSSDDGLFGRTAHELKEVRAHGDAGSTFELYAVFCDRSDVLAMPDVGAIDHFGIDGGLDRFKKIAAC